MSKKDDALKLAREALKHISSHYMSLPKIGCMALAAVEEAMAEQPAQQQEPEPDRVKFERHWRKTRGEKKANRELPRHPLQPQTYIQDSANRHWVTWQAAVRSVSTPASKPWVGLTEEEIEALWDSTLSEDVGITALRKITRAIETKLREKNA